MVGVGKSVRESKSIGTVCEIDSVYVCVCERERISVGVCYARECAMGEARACVEEKKSLGGVG